MSKTMFICSTQHQVVNLVPAITEEVDYIVIFTTKTAYDWSRNLQPVLDKRNIKYEIVPVQLDTETDIGQFSECIKNELDKYKDREILLNSGGGQKPWAMAVMKVFIESDNDSLRVVYTEANTRQLVFISKDMRSELKDYSIDLSLEEILTIYGYTFWVSSNAEEAKTQNINLKNINEDISFSKAIKNSAFACGFLFSSEAFRKAFFPSMIKDDQTVFNGFELKTKIQGIIKHCRPHLETLKPVYCKGQHPEELLKKIESEKMSTDDLKKILRQFYSQPKYDQFWKPVKNFMIEKAIENLSAEYQNPLNNGIKYNEAEENELIDCFTQLDGQIEFEESLIKSVRYPFKNGEFFEKMVLSEVLKFYETDAGKKYINEIWINVRTQKKENPTSKNEAEYDIVIVSNFGTLILLEIKSAKFDNHTAKGQERDVLKKSGPYGKAIMIGPLLSEMKPFNEENARKDRYPYLSIMLYDQYVKIQAAGLEYWCLDEVAEKLKNMINQ